MKRISSQDSSILAFLAQRPELPSDRLEELISRLEDDRTQRTARAIVNPSEASRADKEAADELRAWAAQQGPLSGHEIGPSAEDEPDEPG